MNTATIPDTKGLFDLVAPIVICGAADAAYEGKAIEAWRKIVALPAEQWQGRQNPNDLFEDAAEWDLKSFDDFNTIYRDFALDLYNELFEEIVAEHGPAELEKGYDYWGAKGYKLPHQTSKNFEISGEACGFYPMYETADRLIERLKAIAP